MSKPDFFGLKVGDMVFVAHQKTRSNTERKTETVPISKVGRKYFYIRQHGRDLPFDPATGQSVHNQSNERMNGYGFDVYREDSWFRAEQQHFQNVSALRKLLDFYAIGKLTPSQAESILEILGR